MEIQVGGYLSVCAADMSIHTGQMSVVDLLPNEDGILQFICNNVNRLLKADQHRE